MAQWRWRVGRWWSRKLGGRIRRYVGRDRLTGLGTWQQGMRLLERDIRRGEGGAAITCDIDNLKEFNYANGHALGDELLRLIAATLMSMLGPFPPYGRGVYRYGGDEFLIRLPGADLAAAQRVAEGARAKIKRLPASLDASQYEGRPLTARFAVAAWPRDAAPAVHELLQALDEALSYPNRDTVAVAHVQPT